MFSCSVTSDSLRPHGLQHARLPCPSLSPGACSSSRPLSQCCHPTISSSVIPFSCLLSFPASGSFLMSQLFTSDGQTIWNFGLSISPSNEYSGLISFWDSPVETSHPDIACRSGNPPWMISNHFLLSALNPKRMSLALKEIPKQSPFNLAHDSPPLEPQGEKDQVPFPIKMVKMEAAFFAALSPHLSLWTTSYSLLPLESWSPGSHQGQCPTFYGGMH